MTLIVEYSRETYFTNNKTTRTKKEELKKIALKLYRNYDSLQTNYS